MFNDFLMSYNQFTTKTEIGSPDFFYYCFIPFLIFDQIVVSGSSSIDQFLSILVLAVTGKQLINNHLLSAILEHSSVKLSLCVHMAVCHRQRLRVDSVPGRQTKQVQNSRSVYFEQVASICLLVPGCHKKQIQILTFPSKVMV